MKNTIKYFIFLKSAEYTDDMYWKNIFENLAYGITPHKGIKIKDLVSKIIQHSERDLKIVHDLSKPTVPTSLFLDCSKAKELLGWEPKHTLDEGIIKTLEWYKENKIKPIAVIIQSRDRVDKLRECINMLYNTCYSKDNFDIVVTIDDDQIELYSSIKDQFPNVLWLYSKHQPNHWSNLRKTQNDFIKNSDYYFIWSVCDDMYGLKPNWDKAIKSKKSYFKDDLFTMYNSNDNRNINGIYGFGFCDKENITNEEMYFVIKGNNIKINGNGNFINIINGGLL